jgi:hypothetical protein
MSDLQFWTDRIPMHYSVADAENRGSHPSLVGTATSYWNIEHRKEAKKKGWALKDGSYPIKDVADLKKAIQAIGRAKNRARVVRHIKKRARALGHSELAKDLKERI